MGLESRMVRVAFKGAFQRRWIALGNQVEEVVSRV